MRDGVQRHVSVDVGVQMQSGVRGLLWAHELMAWREGSSRHRGHWQSRSFLLTDVTFTRVWSWFGLEEKTITCLFNQTKTGLS